MTSSKSIKTKSRSKTRNKHNIEIQLRKRTKASLLRENELLKQGQINLVFDNSEIHLLLKSIKARLEQIADTKNFKDVAPGSILYCEWQDETKALELLFKKVSCLK